MSGPLIVLVLCATAVVALGLQVLSRQMQRNPVDVRPPDPLIDVSRSTSVTHRPAELHYLVGIIADARLSDASYRAGLQPLLDELRPDDHSATAKPVERAEPARSTGRRRSRRVATIDDAIAELEAAWGVEAEIAEPPG